MEKQIIHFKYTCILRSLEIHVTGIYVNNFFLYKTNACVHGIYACKIKHVQNFKLKLKREVKKKLDAWNIHVGSH